MDADNDYDFANWSLGLFEVEAIPRIGETVFYEVDDQDEDYYDGKQE